MNLMKSSFLLGKNLSFLLILFLSLTFFQSCVKDNDTPKSEEEAPRIPSMETFVMPFDGFSESDVDTTEFAHQEGGARSLTFRNWAFAGGNILVWNIAIGVTMAVPVASFAESFNHDPVYLGNGVFAWNYAYNVAGAAYNATLTGEFVNGGDDVQWIMTISQVGGFSDFEYYRGVVATDLSQANWTLNHQPNNPEPYLDIEYAKDDAAGTASIRYTNIIPGSANNGDYIEYRVQPGNEFNRAYDVYRIDADNLLEIEWDEPSTAGQVTNLAHFGDSDPHCWDEDKMDVDCE